MKILEIQIQSNHGEEKCWDVKCIHKQLNQRRSEVKGKFEIKDWDDLEQAAIEPSKYKEYGQLLGETLFKDSVREKFMFAVSENSQGDRLRVLLDIEDKKLTTLRWEKLRVPTELGWEFARLDSRITFSVYVPSPVDTSRFPAISKRDLRALVLVASPKDRPSLKEFSVKETVESIEAAFKVKKIHCHVLANIDGYQAPTLSNLREKLQHKPSYTLLHIVCHGLVDRDKKDISLYWATADHQTERVQGANLIKNLSEFPTPHFTFLCACESASLTEEQALGGLAGRLVRELGMQAVVAMTDKVEIKTAQNLAEQFYKNLLESGQVDLALAEAKPPESGDADIIVPALFSRLAGLPLFSDSLEKELNDADIKLGLERLFEVNQNSENEMPDDSEDESKNQRSEDSKSSEKKYVSLIQKHAPILQGEFEKERKILEEIREISPNQRDTEVKKKQNNALHNLNNLCQEVFSHQYNKNFIFNDLAFMEELPPYDARCPFRGLLSFDLKSREFFFGREKYINNLKQKLEDNKFVAVIGGSGSGKSSLVKAGLISKLLEDSKLSEEELKQIVCFAPDKNPYSQLDEHLKKNSLPPILIVDQFEELFTVSHETERQKFINELLKLINQQKVRIVITMRVDFWEECATYNEKFQEKIEKSQLFILPMTSKELRDAMKRQGEEVGLIFEAGLEKLIQNEVEGEPGAMPLLQHALLELWKRRHGQWLLCDEYEKIGTDEAPGLKGAIAKTAEDFYDGEHNGEKLSDEDKKQVKNILMCLTQVDKNAVQGEPRRDTRRRVAKEDLLTLNKKNPNRIWELVTILADRRLVITSENKETKQIEVEVAHEALIRYWPRLRKWLEHNRNALMLRDKIREYAEDWDKHGTKDEFLNLGGEQLEKAEELSKNESIFLGELERKYVHACKDLRVRQERAQLEKNLDVYTAYSEMLFEKNKRLDAIAKLIEAGDSLKKGPEITEYKRLNYLIIFGKLFNELAEYNSLHAHEGIVSSISFGREENEIFASVGYKDGMIKFWKLDGTQIKIVQEGHELPALKGEHRLPILDLTFSSDGKMLASASQDGSIKLWKTRIFLLKEVESNRQFIFVEQDETPRHHEDNVCSVSFNDKYKKIASASRDQTVKLWSYEVNTVKPLLLKHEDKVVCVSVSPNGETMVSGDESGNLRLWSSDGKLLKKFKAHNSSVLTVNFSPDSKTLVSCSSDKFIKLWDTNAERIEQPIKKFVEEEEVYYATFSPDGKKIASANKDGTIVIRFTDGKILKILRGHREGALKVMFSPNSQFIVSCGEDGNIKFWHCKSRFEGHDNEIWGIDFSAKGETIITASIDKTARLWTRNGDCLKILSHNNKVHIAKLSPNGRTAATITEDGVLRIWNDIQVNDNKTLNNSIYIPGNTVRNISFSPVDDVFITLGKNEIIRIFDIKGNLLNELNENYAHKGEITTLTFSMNSNNIISTSTDKTVKLWELNGAKLVQITEIITDSKNDIYYVSFSHNHQKFAIVNQSDNTFEVKILNIKGELITIIRGNNKNERIRDIKFNQNDTMIVLVTLNSVEFWSINGTFLQRSQLINDKDINEIEIYKASISSDWSAIAVAFTGRQDLENRIGLYNLNLKEAVENAYQYINKYFKFI